MASHLTYHHYLQVQTQHVIPVQVTTKQDSVLSLLCVTTYSHLSPPFPLNHLITAFTAQLDR